jgi:hypothetical protein
MGPSLKKPGIRARSVPQLAPGVVLPPVRPAMFELHIRPMFRTLDREHMSFTLNLWQYFDAPAPRQLQFYQLILNRLKAPDPGVVMPPPNEGGPWPAEWIALFERWINEGMRRLDRATVDTTRLSAARDPASQSVSITGQGTKPSAGYVVWIERSYDPNRMYAEYLPDEFVVYQEQRTSFVMSPTRFSFQDYFEVPQGVTQLAVIDAVGRHTVRIS